MSLSEQISLIFCDKEEFSLQDVYEAIPEKPKTTIRGRIYDNLGIKFEKLRKGVYRTIKGNSQCIVIEGNGRDLSFLEDNSVDLMINDHPWLDEKSNKGGSRKFTDKYDCFLYNKKDFEEKFRVLKEGSFLVEILPAENENNYDYLYYIKKVAQKCGFLYYSKVAWKKGNFVSNTGRKAKNTEDIMVFTKGKARKLRLDKKKSNKTGETHYMSGANGMLPTEYFEEDKLMYDLDVQAVPRKDKIHQSEKPLGLLQMLIEFFSLPGELIVDQFAGSGVTGEAAINVGRNCILIEKLKENIEKIVRRIQCEVIMEKI